MSSLSQLLPLTLLVTLTLLWIVWLISLIRHDASVVDPFWGLGFVGVAWLCWSLSRAPSDRATLIVILTTIWGVRLSLFLLWRNWGHGEDRRYRKMRDHHGRRFWRVSLFTVFLLQAVILWFVALPVQVTIAQNEPTSLGPLDAIGVALWCVGLYFEAVGDWQLARFSAEPANAGRVMDQGLWRYTRHPNYFGDFCVWWGLYLIATAGGAAWTVASPIVMSVLLLKVSGVALLESTIAQRRPGYREYVARTNAFFPAPPRASAGLRDRA